MNQTPMAYFIKEGRLVIVRGVGKTPSSLSCSLSYASEARDKEPCFPKHYSNFTTHAQLCPTVGKNQTQILALKQINIPQHPKIYKNIQTAPLPLSNNLLRLFLLLLPFHPIRILIHHLPPPDQQRVSI